MVFPFTISATSHQLATDLVVVVVVTPLVVIAALLLVTFTLITLTIRKLAANKGELNSHTYYQYNQCMSPGSFATGKSSTVQDVLVTLDNPAYEQVMIKRGRIELQENSAYGVTVNKLNA